MGVESVWKDGEFWKWLLLFAVASWGLSSFCLEKAVTFKLCVCVHMLTHNFAYNFEGFKDQKSQLKSKIQAMWWETLQRNMSTCVYQTEDSIWALGIMSSIVTEIYSIDLKCPNLTLT